MNQENLKSEHLAAWSPETYRAWKEGYRGPYLGARNFRAVTCLARRFLKGRVLDAGCGDGSTMRALRERFPKLSVCGADLAPSPLPGAVRANLADLPFESGAFDCVLCMDVLEHLPIEACAPILGELRRVLKAKGALCSTVPNNEDLQAALMFCPQCHGWFHPYGHTRRFTGAGLRAELERGGFREVQVRSYGVDAYFHFGRAGGPVSRLGRLVLPRMRWDEMLFAAGTAD